jgi:acyl carrier protein
MVMETTRAELLDTIATAIAEVRQLEKSSLPALRPESSLIGDLALSSLEVMKLALALEQRFGVTIEEGAEFSVRTIGDLVAFIEARRQPAATATAIAAPG